MDFSLDSPRVSVSIDRALQAANDANMIFTDKAILAHVKFDMGDVWESKVESILKAIQVSSSHP